MLKNNIRPRDDVMLSLRGGCPKKIPFTIYDNMISSCNEENELRQRGLCIVKRISSYKIYHPNTKTKILKCVDEQGRHQIKTIYSTPYGELSTLIQPAGFTSWQHEYMFKSPEDYKAILFYIQDTVVEPNYDEIVRIAHDLEDDEVLRDCLPLEPLQSLISSSWMSMEDFCFQWMDCRDEILKLYNAFVDLARKIYPIVANGPVEHVNYGGNVIPSMIGVETFKKYYVPHYNEAAEVLHKNNKLIGCHFDADNTLIMDAIGETELDYIEAYDLGISPPVKDARKAWPDKVLWINWPSSWHLNTVSDIKLKTQELIREASPGRGFIIGITEDVPQERLKSNLMAIMDGIEGYD